MIDCARHPERSRRMFRFNDFCVTARRVILSVVEGCLEFRRRYKSQKMKLFYVYIVKCRDDSYYTGMTNDIERRLEEHN
jgi:hypothetical protein